MHTMTAKYNGKCACCGVAIRKGETIIYDRSKGAFHPSCSPDERSEFNRRDNSSFEDRACGNQAYEDACAAACGYGL